MIEILKTLFSMSYADFLSVMNKEDDYYTQGKFNEMKKDLARFLCELDEDTANNFINYAGDKTGVLL
ncbi:MAG TPA: hypothetical protein ENJ60_03595 [Aeromonadales bacterium]|nr:hypothetical protein [Aeromonadales bacterium]